ncbi:MAG TPA: dolichyl-phosphate beta-D-mannosyltransferase [Rikenellaceae bacterium]|nr:dolichyl-phosphate beta-D-mannosyltransferase [Rikenellaceae bacterium]
MEKKLVIIPTYNEIENIGKIIAAVSAIEGEYHILVIDDGSPDGTGDAVRNIQSQHPDRVFLMERSGKLGLGTAYVAGFKWAKEHDYDYVFEMDADFSHNPSDLPRLLAACTEGGADMSVGSRYCDGINVVNWPMGRILISYCASIYVRTILGFKIFDSTAGFVCYSKRVLDAIDLDAVRMKGYGFQIELKYTAHKLGFKIAEVPVIFVNRKEGTSKMSGSIFGEAFWGVLALRFRKFKKAVH